MTRTVQQSAIQVADRARPPSEAPPLGRVGPWDLVRVAGEGPLTRVYRARASGAGEHRAAYAVKVLRGHWEDAPEAVALIGREALVGRQVSHPNLVPVLSAQVTSPPYYLVMPWLAGATLDQRLKRQGPSRTPVALWHVRQAASALDALHQAGWMHGDVTPRNVLVSPQGHVTLVDLGFARQPGEAGWALDRLVLGTVHYLAPEMVTSSWGADIRSDIYSLGATLFELLTGRPPFDAADLAELVRQHRQEWPPRLHHLAPHVPPEVDALVRQMLAKQPLRRPQTPRELVERLARLEIATFAI